MPVHLDNCTENDFEKTSCNGVMRAGSGNEEIAESGNEETRNRGSGKRISQYEVDQLVSGSSDEKIKLIRA